MSIKYYILIIFLIFASFLPGLGVLEFFRHTEADRTLISQEMLENQNFVVPHLLGQPILTKPPLYYLLSAAIFKMNASYDEFSSRLLSVLASCLLAIIHFAACRAKSLEYALGSTFVLISSLAFITLGTAAEIDMLYAALCAGSLYLLYFSQLKNSFYLLIASYLLAGLAFLTKGPPIIAFYFLTSVISFLVDDNRNYKKYILWNTLGVLSFLAILSIWFIPLLNQIDFIVLKEQFYNEILGRAVGEPRKSRGLLFYFGSVLGSTMPWSIVFLICAILDRKKISEVFKDKNSLVSFCFIVFVSGFVLLSLAKGKSSRYVFPLHSFAVQVLFFVIYNSKDFWLKKNVQSYLKILLFFLFFSVLIGGLYLNFKINKIALIYLTPILFFLLLSFKSKNLKMTFLAIVLSVLSVRLPIAYVYAPYRNLDKSVKPMVESIINESKNSTIYSAIMYERWVQYYLKRRGVKVIQLQGLNNYLPSEEKIYWLVTDKDENDLLELIKKDSSSILIKKFALPNTNMYFYHTPTQAALGMLDYIKKNRKDDGIF